MQQVQAFSADPYRCAGLGAIGMGTGFQQGPTLATGGGKQYKVHTNGGFNNFNYIHGDPEARAMTRIVFNNGNGNRNDFHCGTDPFQNCMTGEVIDTTGNYQLNFMNANPNMNNMRYMRQPVNPTFQADNQLQRCYIQRPQQPQQARFVRVQGSKMRPNNCSYRNFNNNNNNQQRQKQNRNNRFTGKVYNNNYKPQRGGVGGDQHDEFFDEEPNETSPKQTVQMQHDCLGSSSGEDTTTDRKSSTNNKQEGQQHSKPKFHHHRSNTTSGSDARNHSSKGNATSNHSMGGALLEPKIEYIGNSLHDLSYDDITENSDDNEDSDLRNRLSRKKHDHIIKREPGELDSDDDDVEPPPQDNESKRKSGRRTSEGTTSKKQKKADFSENSEKEAKCTKDAKKFQKSGRKESAKGGSHSSYSSPYSYHDDRTLPFENDKTPRSSKGFAHKSNCPGPSFSSAYSDSATGSYCCAEAEVADLREKLNTMKESLRDANDKLLEANVVGSKKTTRLQEEIIHLKKKLEDATKTEGDLKASLKSAENDLSAKTAELNKITMLNEIEKQERTKLSAEMTRTYKERLTIEVEKLRALFDVEVAKMQAFYMSSNIYEEDTNIPFSSDVPSDVDLQNQNHRAAQNEESPGSVIRDVDAMNVNLGTRDVHNHSDVPFMQGYFNASPQATPSLPGASPFSLFENVMAYNSLIHHQHIYAQTTASAAAAASGSTHCSADGSGISSISHA